MSSGTGKDRIIFPLDVESAQQALAWVNMLIGHVGAFKIGLELFTRAGPEIVREVMGLGGRVFLDLKFGDIPNTVGSAARAAADLKVWMFNFHASAGHEAIEAAVANRANSLAIGVTVLTSIKNGCVPIFGAEPGPKVLQFAHMLKAAGAQGLVCSGQELAPIREQPELSGMVCVVPGIRPDWASGDDQQRIVTPGQAILRGADYLVIGRPIRKPPAIIGSSIRAAQLIAEEIDAAMANALNA